jgi:ADP-dependent NAD(P)H-hydrate dehydratase
MLRSPRAESVRLTSQFMRRWPLPSDPADDKRARGTVLVVAGSERTAGAALLAGLAGLRAGAGRLQIATVDSSIAALAAAVPEALLEGLPATSGGHPDPIGSSAILAERIRDADAVLMGPGFEDLDATRALLAASLPFAGPRTTVVIDAVGIRALAGTDRNLTRPVSGRLALTPNREEAIALLSGEEHNPEESAALARSVAMRHDAVVTVGGHIAAADGREWVAEARVPGLGTSGSGDVLAGLVAGVAARCGDPAQAACWGTYLHAHAGVRLGQRIGKAGYLARELLEEIPKLMDDAAPSDA